MITESTYIISKIHQMDGQACQDYAAHTEDELYVSDGCSTSTNTDIGARILTRLAMDYSKNDSFYLPRDRRFYKALQTASNTICTAMNLSPMVMGCLLKKLYLGIFLSIDYITPTICLTTL